MLVVLCKSYIPPTGLFKHSRYGEARLQIHRVWLPVMNYLGLLMNNPFRKPYARTDASALEAPRSRSPTLAPGADASIGCTQAGQVSSLGLSGLITSPQPTSHAGEMKICNTREFKTNATQYSDLWREMSLHLFSSCFSG